MDRVRFGRVLGRGTRLAARTLYEAVDAATSTPAESSGPAHAAPRAPLRPSVSTRPGPAQPPRVVSSGHSQTKPASRSIFAPVKRASRAVSLEVTGSFFALFAVAFAVAAWHSRQALAAGGAPLSRFVIYATVMLLFVYFAASNFLRARRLK